MSAPQIPGLRRELRFWETIALSIGIMAPTAAMALNGVGVAANVGRAVPLLFIVATIGVFLVSYGFVRLSAHYAHAGSVYAFSGATLGPQAGFFAGWALLGTYLAFTAASASEIGLFFGAFLDGTGIWHDPEWVAIALVAAVLIGLLAYGDIKVTTRALLSMEAVSVTLIVILIVVIFAKLIGGSPPGHGDISSDAFSLPEGVGTGAFGLGVVLAFLSFAGFEGAAALGEETDNPRREIPRAIRNAVLAAGIFYIICMLAQTWGFGTDAAGVAAFASSGSPLGDLGSSYIGSWMGDAINLGAAVSAFASSLGTATGASRILYAMGRDGFGTSRLGTSSQRTGAPAAALLVVMTIAIAAIIGMRLNDTNVVNAFFYPGTIGVLSLLVAYIVTNIGAVKLFAFDRQEKPWEMGISVLGIAFLLYVLWRNVSDQVYPYNHFWQVVGVWLLVGLGIVLLVPGLARRIGAGLARLEDGNSP
ncbi:MAG: APC family permease [Microvirga sp.]|jgi:amino acid transporter